MKKKRKRTNHKHRTVKARIRLNRKNCVVCAKAPSCKRFHPELGGCRKFARK